MVEKIVRVSGSGQHPSIQFFWDNPLPPGPGEKDPVPNVDDIHDSLLIEH